MTESSFFTYFFAHSHLFRSIAHRILFHNEDIEEVLNDSALQGWQKLALFDESKGSLNTWLSTIVWRRSIDKIRRINYNEKLVENLTYYNEDLPTPADLPTDYSLIYSAISDLPDAQQHVILHGWMAGISQRSYATLHSLPLGTVKTRWDCALDKLSCHPLVLSFRDKPPKRSTSTVRKQRWRARKLSSKKDKSPPLTLPST